MTTFRLSSVLLLCTALTGCFLLGTDRVEWSEEVVLHDESTIAVSRSAQRHAYGPDGRGTQLWSALTYAPSNVDWRLEGNDHLLSFDVIGDTGYVVLLAGSDVCTERPANLYQARYWATTPAGLQEVSEAEVPLDKVRVNLYGRYWGNSPEQDARGLVTLKTKFARDTTRRNAPPLSVWFERHGWLVCEAVKERLGATPQVRR